MLTAEQKYDISSAIYADTLQEIDQNKKKSEKMIDTLRSGELNRMERIVSDLILRNNILI